SLDPGLREQGRAGAQLAEYRRGVALLWDHLLGPRGEVAVRALRQAVGEVDVDAEGNHLGRRSVADRGSAQAKPCAARGPWPPSRTYPAAAQAARMTCATSSGFCKCRWWPTPRTSSMRSRGSLRSRCRSSGSCGRIPLSARNSSTGAATSGKRDCRTCSLNGRGEGARTHWCPLQGRGPP